MPKLSRSRVINLNYNDGKRTIYNEVFDYGKGLNTLFSMDNGIGKTVLIQFLMQPFIRNKRDIAGRRFIDYFQKGLTTYIMHEVLLENNDKLLVGMIIKKDSGDEIDRLKIISFTHHYNNTNDYDLINIPFIEEKRILKFQEAEEILKKGSRNSPRFKYYNFNDSSKKRKYFEDLSYYRLDYKEWEQIIKSINDDESGLSSLYDKYKDDEALLKHVIIPLIESKLNTDKNLIENIKTNLTKFIESFKRSKESIRRIEIYKNFIKDCGPINEKIGEGNKLLSKKTTLQYKLMQIALLCEQEIENQAKNINNVKEVIDKLNKQLKQLNLEEFSYEYHKLEQERIKLEFEMEALKCKLGKEEVNLVNLNKEYNLQKAAEQYEELLKERTKIAEIKERIDNYTKSDSEIAIKIKNFQYSLKIKYNGMIQQKEKNIELLNTKCKEISNSINDIEHEQKTNDEKLKVLHEKLAVTNNNILQFEEYENTFKRKYLDFTYEKNPLLNEYNKENLEIYKQNIINEIEQIKTEMNEITIVIEDLEKEIDTNNNTIERTKNEIQDKKLYLNKLNNDLDNFKKASEPIIKLLNIKEFDDNIYLNKGKLLDKILSEGKQLEEKKDYLLKQLQQAKETLEKYRTGLQPLPKEVEQCFVEKGINYEYGLSWLQKLEATEEEKEMIINNNPFFPYGILLNDSDITILKEEDIEIFSSIPMPLINKSKLNITLDISRNNSIITVNNQDFLLAFNNYLIKEEELKQLIGNVEIKIKDLEEELDVLNKGIKNNQNNQYTVQNYLYEGNESEEIFIEINDIEKSLKKLEEKVQILVDEQGNNKINLKEKKEKLITLEFELPKIQNKLSEFNSFIEKYELRLDNLKKIEKYNIEKDDLNNTLNILKEKLKEKQNSSKQIDIKLNGLERKLEEYKAKHNQYSFITEGEFIDLNIEELESKLKANEEKYGNDLKRDKDDLEERTNKVNKCEIKLDEIIIEGNLSDEYKTLIFSNQVLNRLKKEIKDKELIIKEIETDIHNKDKNIAVIINDRDNITTRIKELGFNKFLPVQEIRDSQFKQRKDLINNEIEFNEKLIISYDKRINHLQHINSSVSSFRNYSYTEVTIDFAFSDINTANKEINTIINDYNTITKNVDEKEKIITREMDKLYEKYRDKDLLIKERLYDLKDRESKLQSYTIFDSLQEVIHRNISTLSIELKNIYEEEEVVINEVIRYSKRILEELLKIDSKSSIKYLGKTQKMLKIKVPEQTEEENLVQYIKEKIKYYSEFEEDYSNELDNEFRTSELLSRYLGNLNRVKIEIKKIEKTGLVKKSWKETLFQNSGGEKFVSMFILLASFMSYMRKKETDIDIKEDEKIIIMDNPFAKTQSEHLLEPMFQIAEKYNIQLICFTGITASSIYNQFKKIYVAKVIEDRFKNKESVSFKAGNDETLELTDFTISKEQISLF